MNNEGAKPVPAASLFRSLAHFISSFFVFFFKDGVNGFGGVFSAFSSPRLKRSSAPGSSSISDFGFFDMSQDKDFGVGLMAAYGVFLMAWAVWEHLIEVAIAKECSLDIDRAHIVTCDLGYERKASILRSLLSLHGDKYKRAIGLISTATKDAKRNTLLHGHLRMGDDKFLCYKRKTDTKYSVSKFEFSGADLLQQTIKLTDHTKDLQSELSISHDDLDAHSMATVKSVTNSSTGGRAQTK